MTQDELMQYFASLQQPQSMVNNQIDVTGRGSGDQRTNLNQFGNIYQQYRPMAQLTDEERAYYDQLGNGNAQGAYVRSIDPRELEERGIDVNSAMYDLPSRKFTEEEKEFLESEGVAADGGNVGILNVDSQPVKDLLSQMDVSDRYMNDEQRKSNNKKNDKSGPTDEQKKSGGELPEEKDKRGFFKKQWDKFTDPDSSAPRNLLDFGLAMMANSKGAGNDFLGTVAQSVGDTVDKVDARKLAALETAKDNLAGKLERTKTISDIEDNIVTRYTSEVEDMNGNKNSVTDWMKVSAAMDELDPEGDYFSKSYITEIAKNGFGMPALNEDGQYELEVPTDNNQAFKYFKQMEYIGMMNPDKEPKDIEIVVGNRIMSLQMIMDEQLKQMQG